MGGLPANRRNPGYRGNLSCKGNTGLGGNPGWTGNPGFGGNRGLRKNPGRENPGLGGNLGIRRNPGYGGDPDLGRNLGKRGHCTMFVARVLCGQTAVGNSGLRVPPAGCHSCVNNMGNPSFYIIFDHNQCYPEYMIEYTR